MTDATPIGITLLPGVLFCDSREIPVQVAVKQWSDAERRARAFKRTGKLVGTVFLCSLIGLFVHILLLVIVPSLLLAIAGSGWLYGRFLGEKASFYYIVAACPHCGKGERLRPYLSAQFQPEITAQCAECGQTARIRA